MDSLTVGPTVAESKSSESGVVGSYLIKTHYRIGQPGGHILSSCPPNSLFGRHGDSYCAACTISGGARGNRSSLKGALIEVEAKSKEGLH
jgi:hypothetical protein